MSEHRATIAWKRVGPSFSKGQYSREHTWTFDGGVTVPASPLPVAVPAPWSNPSHVDPEEAFVASIASCHMLWFLWGASKRGFRVESYRDEALGVMEKNAEGRMAMTAVTLRPHVVFTADPAPPGADVFREIHDTAHHECYIANSVKTEIRVEPTFEVGSL